MTLLVIDGVYRFSIGTAGSTTLVLQTILLPLLLATGPSSVTIEGGTHNPSHDVAKQTRRYINSEAAAGEHLADQLLLPMALSGGGSFTTTPLSSHATTNLDVIRRFPDVRIDVSEVKRGLHRVRVG